MTILFSLLLIISIEASTPPKAPPIQFLVTGQSISRRQHFFVFTRVNFKIVNKSKNTVVIYGLKRDGVFEPTGDVAEFNNETNSWIYKTESKEPTQWRDLSDNRREEYALGPNQEIKFSEEYVNVTGKRLKRTAFVSLRKAESPRKIETQAFDVHL